MTLEELYERYGRSEIEFFIDEFIFKERDREILKRHLLDGILYKQIAEEFHMDPHYLNTIGRKNTYKLIDRIDRYEKKHQKITDK